MKTRMIGLSCCPASAPLGTKVCQAWFSPAGSWARMPTVMMSETPLPMPRSVIWSPSHIRNMVPAVMVAMVISQKPGPGFGTRSMCRRAIVSVMPLRKGFEAGFSREMASR